MDLLDHVLPAADPLLRRIDTTLTQGGAPPGHPVWAELRRVRLLPGDGVHSVSALRPEALTALTDPLRSDADTCAIIADTLPPPDPWSGTAADTYETARRRTADHLSGGPESLDTRLTQSATLADSLAHWMTTTRNTLAMVLADLLATLEPTTLAAPTPNLTTPQDTTEAATAATRILQTIADAYESAADLLDATRPLTHPLIAIR